MPVSPVRYYAITLDLRALNRLPAEMDRRFRGLAERMDVATAEAVTWIRKRKLSLPGLPVMKGGRSGPSPGHWGEQVLHRDTGDLIASVAGEGIRKRISARTKVLSVGIGIDRRRRGAKYAFAHEFGSVKARVPSRPFLRPGWAYLQMAVRRAIEAEFAVDVAMDTGGGLEMVVGGDVRPSARMA